MAVPNPGAVHFWNPNQEAYSLIKRMYYLPSDHSQEDIVDHIWVAICRLYFPQASATANGVRWTALREPYRGPPNNPRQHRPNVIVVRLLSQLVQSGMRVYSRDHIWIECKSILHNTPSRWKNLINETTVRLNSAHPNRTVTVIVAVGLRMMSFLWDPTNTINRPRMSIHAAYPHTTVWNLDPRLKHLAGGWASPATGRIDLSRALTIDCITEETVNGQQVLAWMGDLAQIEQLQVYSVNTVYPALNAGHWSC